MTDTANLDLPYIEAAQAQKHVTHNEALRILDTLVQLTVLDRDLAAPPGAPSEGQRWIVTASPTGAWAGHATHVAAWQDDAWQFSVPKAGWITYVVDEGTLLVWNGSAWGDFFSTVTAVQNLARLGVGTTADATNPFSAKLNNALWVAKTVAEGGDGNLHYKLSKESSTKTLSLLLQDNFSGRAEFGLTGDDNFHIKVSSDGSSWKEALSIDGASGKVGLGTAAATQMLDVVGNSSTAAAIFDNASYSAGKGGAVLLQHANASGSRVTYASLNAYATTGTAGAEVGDLVFKTMQSGALTEALRLTGAGIATFAGTTEATSASAAAAIFAGGVGIAKKLFVTGATSFAGIMSITNTTGSTSTTTGALTVAGGLGVANKLFVGDSINLKQSQNGIGGGIRFIRSDNTDYWDEYVGGDSNLYIQFGSAAYITISSAGACKWSAYGAGSLTTDAGGNITAASDARKKTRVADFTRSVIDLRAAGCASIYDWRPDSGLAGRGVGWLLADGEGMCAAIPEAVGRGPDGFLTFADRPVLAAVVNGLLDHDDEITALKQRVTQIESALS